MEPATLINVVELAYRFNAGTHVSLNWDRVLNTTQVVVTNDETCTVQSAIVPNNQALEAFNHPFCYIDADQDEENN
jgi:hypothetical protein